MKIKLLYFLLFIAIASVGQNKNKTIGFKENKGQIIDQKGRPNNGVKYLLNSGGLNVQLRKNGFSYDIYEAKKHRINHSRDEKSKSFTFSNDNKKLPDYTIEYQFHRIDIDFLNSNPKVEFITEEKSLDYDNYYNIPNKPEGVLMVYQYRQITYKNIYPNIDVVFSVPKDTLKTVEYNFVVHPKGKISDIQLKFSGAPTKLVNNKIRMSVRFGEMEETLPASWTEDGELKKEITVGYTKIKKNVYGFKSSENVPNKKVIIDPVPVRLWGTYYGGENRDSPGDIFVKDNFVYWSGETYSTNNIASLGAYQNYFASNGGYDAFFTKLNSDGTRVWGTYYGGSNDDGISQIKVSNNDNIYIAGTSRSTTNISTTGSYQPIKSEDFDGFLAKFDTNGFRIWGTYYGGLSNDKFSSIIIDSDEKIYVSGETGSMQNISSNGAFQPNFLTTITSSTSGGLLYNGMIVKFDANGNRIWGTYYYPGTIFDSKMNSNGELFFLGTSLDFSLPNTEWKRKGLLIKLSPTGNKIWDMFIGGNSEDAFIDLGLDANNNLYCSGQTTSVSGIATTGVFQETYIQNNMSKVSGCVLKFNQNGQKIWGSYFFPETLGASVSKSGDIYFTGRVENGFVTTPNAYQENPLSNNAGTDSYLVKFNTNGQREWATYYSGESADNAYITAVDDNSYIYLSGTTNSQTNIATLNTHQPNLYPSKASYLPNTADAFLVKFKDCNSLITASTNSPICIGKSLELKASGGTNYTWTGPNGFTSTDQNPTIPNATAINSGQYSCSITGTPDCDGVLTVDVLIGDTVAPIPNLTTLPTITGDCHTTITTIPTATDTCAGAITATTTSPLSYSLPGTYNLIWNYNDGNGNSVIQNQTVSISSQPLPTASSPQTFCIQQNATINSISITGQNIKWYDTLTAGTLLPNTTVIQDGKSYYASQTINGCESERIPVAIAIQSTLAPTGVATQSFCSSQNPTIANIQISGTSIKWYDGTNNGTLLAETTSLQNGKTYYASQTHTNCESPRLGIAISIVNTPTAPTANGNQAFCKSQNATLDHIQISGQNIKWYESSTSTNVLPNTTVLENNKTYYASQTIGCESARTAVSIQINDATLPTGSNNQQFCIDENATIANLNITGNNLKWYDSAVSGNILQESTLQNGFYYATQTLNNCESERYAVTVKVQDTQIPIVDSPQVFCIQKNALIRDINIMGQNIKWYDSYTSSVSLSESTLLANGITYYASQIINNCESDRIPVTINILEATIGDCINLVDELPFPKFFTPNNDGYNDIWTIDFAYLASKSTIRIFDRYGKLIKELTPDSSWDGTYQNLPLPSTDYWFVVTRLNGAEFRAHFSLKR